MDHVRPSSCGMCVTLKMGWDGCKQFVISAHLPHCQCSDCIEVWQTFKAELDQTLTKRRLTDSVMILIDTNYEIGSPGFHCQFGSSNARACFNKTRNSHVVESARLCFENRLCLRSAFPVRPLILNIFLRILIFSCAITEQ